MTLAAATAPAPVEPGDLVAADEAVFQIEVVLVAPPGANSVAVLARRGMPVVRLS